MQLNKKRRIILIFLLLAISSILFFIILLVKFYSCVKLPNEYSFLESHFTSKSCYEKKYSVKGIIYNTNVDSDSDITFDMNLWDLNENNNIYLNNLSILKKDINHRDIEKLTDYQAITLEVSLNKNTSKILRNFPNTTKVVVKADELNFTKEDIILIQESILEAILVSPLKTFPQNNPYPEKPINAVTTEADFENKVLNFGNGRDNKQLYAPWALSFLLNSEVLREIKKEDIIKMLEYNDITFNLENGDNPYTQCQDPGICESNDISNEKSYSLSDNVFHLNNSLSCLMISEIFYNLNYRDDYILSQYCPLDIFKESISELLATTETDTSIQSSITSYLQSLSVDRITSKEQFYTENDSLSFSNFSSTLLDSYSVNNVYGKVLTDLEIKEQIIFITNTIVEKNDFFLKDICQIDYFLNLISKQQNSNILKEPDTQNVINYGRVFSKASERLLKLTETNLNNWYFCLNTDDLPLSKSLLLRAYYLNFMNNKTEVGIWYDGKYNIKDNAYFIKVITEYKDFLSNE